MQKKYFIKSKDGQYEVIKQIKSKILFSVHDIISDPPFLHLDLLTCRNLLIYFSSELQKKIIPMFHYALNQHALLFLGKSESVGSFQDQFKQLSQTLKLYEAVFTGKKELPRQHFQVQRNAARINERDQSIISSAQEFISLDELVHKVMGEVFFPYSVLINENLDIVFIQGKNPLLIRPEGTPTNSILKNIHPAFSIDLRSAVHTANLEKKTTRTAFQKIKIDGESVWGRLVIVPIDDLYGFGCLYLLFSQVERDLDIPLVSSGQNDATSVLIIEQERQLLKIKEQLQSVIDELETSSEEMQSLNEEFQSSNEELQSANEELETANEEMQAGNEELQSAYAELTLSYENQEHKQLELEKLQHELQKTINLLNDAENVGQMGSFMWNLDTRLWTWSQGCYNLFGLNSESFKPSYEAFIGLTHPEDRQKLELYVNSLQTNQTAMQLTYRSIDVYRNTIWIHLQAFIQITTPSHEKTIIGTIRNISNEVKYQEEIFENEERYRSVFDLASIGISRLAPDGSWLEVNQKLCEILGYSKEELLKLSIQDITYSEDLDKELESMQNLLSDKIKSYHFEKRYIKKTGDVAWVSVSKALVRGNNGLPKYFISITENIDERKLSQQKLLASERHLRESQSIAKLGHFRFEFKTGIWSNSDSLDELFGIDKHYVRDLNGFMHLVHSKFREQIKQYFQTDISHKNLSIDEEYKIIHHVTEEEVWVRFLGEIILDNDGSFVEIFGTLQDITEQKITEDKLQLSANVFTYASEGIMITNPKGVIIDANKAFCTMTGYLHEELVGKTPKLFESDQHNPEFYEMLWSQIQSIGSWKSEVYNRTKSGAVFPSMVNISAIYSKDHKLQYYVALYSDITKIKEQQHLLEHLAHYDALTSLPNRLLLSDRMHQAIKYAQRNKKKIALAFIDLDSFKNINDTYGHETGDRFLIKIAKKMKEVLRDKDTIARLGGDEFIAVIGDLEEPDDCLPIIERFLSVTAEPIEIDGQTLRTSSSIGITFYPQEDDVDVDQMLRQADQAMYQAKVLGKQRYHIFDTSHAREVRQHLAGLEEMYNALRNEEFELHYQPKVNMRSGEILGFEALIRWRHPEKGLLMPNSFLPIIENHRYSIDMGEWVIDRALRQLQEWKKENIQTGISVNIGALQLQESEFVEKLQKILLCYPDIDPQWLELEVLETSALEDIAHVSNVIRKCRDIGINFALDDFGTGYSSLTYLRRLEALYLKIDQSFIRDMIHDHDDLIIVEGVIKLAEAFGRKPIAEGVETMEHGKLLLELNCELGQGYAIAKPMEANKVLDWMHTWTPYPEWQINS